MISYEKSMTWIYFLILIHARWSNAAPGCIVYSEGKNEDSSDALCDEMETKFKIIPQNLPWNLVNLTINNQMIKFLDSSQFTNLPNLTFINLDANGLKAFHKDTFAKLKKLKHLSLKHNQLNLHTESFGSLEHLGLDNLELLDLRHNPLGFVPNHHFSSSTLKQLHLSSTASNFYINPYGLDKMTNLEYLEITYSGLITLPQELKNSFIKMKLKTLLLHANPWYCDCRLEWLKVWYDNLYIRNGGFDQLSMDNNDRNLPTCKEPKKLSGKFLIGTGTNSIKTSELNCSSAIFTPDTSINVVAGSNVTFICDCFSDSQTIVKWFKDDVPIDTFYDHRIKIEQTQGKSFKANLTINSVMMQDEGIWQCVIYDSDKQNSSKFHVGVYPASPGESETFYDRLVNMNSGLMIKYVGLSIACFVLFIMLISLIIYCFYDKSKTDNANKTVKKSGTKFDVPNPNHLVEYKNQEKIFSDNSRELQLGTSGYLYDDFSQMPASIYPGSEVHTSDTNFMTLCPIGEQNFILASPDGNTDSTYGDMLTLRVLPGATTTTANNQGTASQLARLSQAGHEDFSTLQHFTFLPADHLVLLDNGHSQEADKQDSCPLHGSVSLTQRGLVSERKIDPMSLKPLSSTAV